MKYFVKKIYLILLLFLTFLSNTVVFGKSSESKYSQNDISNYLSGIISINQNYTTTGFKYLNRVQSLKDRHFNFNFQFIKTLILLEKFEKAFSFSEEIWNEDENFFEVDLLLGLDSFVKKDYPNAQKYFKRLDNNSEYNLLFEDFLSNILISWIKASENNKDDSFKYLKKIPERYKNLKQIQNAFLNCYFDTSKTEIAYEKLIGDKEAGFSRYIFFLTNYFLSQNQKAAGELLVKKNKDIYRLNLLLKQTNNFIINEKYKKITNFFSCKNPNDAIAEIFYVIANLYSTEEVYQLSNFYLKISLFLNKKFTPNRTLLAENLVKQKKYKFAKNTFNSIKSIGSSYSWYAAVNLAMILSETSSVENSIESLEKEFNLLSNPSFEHYYEIANFYKEKEYYKDSIKYYSLALKNIKKKHPLIPRILDRRGTSYERLGEWDNAEKDLKKSLQISPNQPHVLNYLAYSWVEKKINIEEALVMLKLAAKLKKNDGYIIDSLGWAHYMNKNYTDAEKFLQKAVEIMPLDPIINDHYADALWMLNKKIQARYFWKNVLNLDSAEQELKDKISKKLIFGINKNL